MDELGMVFTYETVTTLMDGGVRVPGGIRLQRFGAQLVLVR